MICVTPLEKKTKRWKKIVEARGLAAAYNLHFKYKGEIPDSELESPVLSLNQEDPLLKEKYFYDVPDGEPVSSSIILNRIANSTHPLNKVAEHLLPYVSKINDANIHLISEGTFAGLYTPSINRIDINKNSRFKGRGAEATIIHEVMHALTLGSITTNTENVQKLNKIYEYLKPMFPAYNQETKEGTYALNNLDEFIVALFSDSAFIKELIKIPAIDTSKSSVLQEVFDYILSLFNISENDSIYRQAFNVATNILEDASVYSEFQQEQYDATFMSPEATNPLIEQFNEREVGKSYSLMNNVWKKEYNRIKNTYGIEPKVIKDNYSAKVIGINTQSLPKFKVKEEYFSIVEKNKSLTMIDSILSKIGIFDTYFRNNEESDNKLKEILSSQGLTNEEIDFLFDLERSSEKEGNNISYLLTQEYSKYTSGDVVIQRLNKLKNLKFDKALEDKLVEFGKSLGIDYEVVDNLKGKFGIDALGVADILNKMIYLAKERKLDTFPEEIAHFYVECLGHKEGLGLNLFNKIEYWSGYQEVLNNYSSVYLLGNGNPDLVKIKKEAVGQAISEAIIKNYVSNAEGYPQEEKDFWKSIINAIKDFLNKFRAKSYIPLETLTNEIAEKILSNDVSQIQDRIATVANKNKELKTYNKTLENYPLATQVINDIISMGGILTGSLALRKQGTIFRNQSETVHDLDFSIDYPSWNGDYLKFLTNFKTLYPNYYALSNEPYFGNGGEYVFNGVITDDPELFKRFKAEKGNFNDRLDKFTLEEQSQMLLIDFFFNPEGNNTKNINGLQSADIVFNAKSAMGMRDKDVFDLINYKPYEQPTELSDYNYLQLPKFKPTPINTLNDLEIEQFKSALETSLQVGGTVNFNYWSESTSEEISEKSIEVLSIEDSSFTGKYADGTERVFRFKNVISKAVPGKYEVHEQEYFKNNLEVGKTVSVNSNGLSYSGTIVEIGDESFTIADDKGDSYTLKYANLDKENHERKILERASEMKGLIENLIDRFSKNAKSQFQIERIAILQQALSYLDNYKDLGDLVKFMKIIQSSIFKSRALMEELANPKELPDNEADKMAEINRRLSMLSFLKDYVESMKSFDRISFAIAESNSSEQLKNVSAQLTAEIQYASRKYYEVAIPNIADWLWMCFPKKLNSQLALIGEEEWTKERLMQELIQPRNDLDFLNSYGVPVANANDIITGLFSKAIKKVLQYARESHIKIEKTLLPFFKKVQDTGAKMEEVYKKFYTIKQMETEEDVEVDGVFTRQTVVKNVRVFIEQYNLQSYYDTVRDYTSKIRQINDKLRDLELTGSTNEIKALITEKKKIVAQLENYQKLTANNYSTTQMNEMMEKLKTSNVPKYLEYRNTFYKVGIENEKSHKVITESGDTIYYNYNGRFYKPNKESVNPDTGVKIFLTPEYENLMKEPQETIDLYTQMKKIYDEKNSLLPEHMKMKGVIPVFYEKKILKDISKSIKNIGNYNDSQELRKKEKKVYTKLNGEPYQSIPVGYTRMLDVEESSDNIMQSLLLWANDVEMYKAKNDVIGSVENLTNVLENNKPLEEGETYASRTNKRAEVIKKYTNQVLYGETRAGDKWWDRVFDYMGKFTALTRMFIKPSSALNNLIIGNYALLSEAIGGRNFSNKELWKAHKNYVDLVATNKTKLNNMLLTLDAIQGRFKDEIGSDFQTFGDTFGFNTAFSVNNTAEHQIQSVSMLALLEKWGIEIPEDGVFEVDKLPENFLGTLHELNKSNNGVYAESDRLYYQDESLFRLFLQFRKYIIPTFRSKYSGMTEKGNNKYRIDVEAGTVELGYYRAFGEFVYNNIIKIKNLPNLIANYNSLNEIEKEGVWRGLVDAVAFASISLLFLPLAGADDDDWDDDEHGTFENLIHWESIYQLARLRGDIGTYIPGFGFNDQSRLVNQPFAGVSTATQLAKIVGLIFDFEEDNEGNVSIWKQYDRDYGRYEKGDLKILQPISKLNPFDNPYEDLFPHVQYNDFKGASR